MNILFFEWDSFGNEDFYEVMEEFGHTIIKLPYKDRTESEEEIRKRIDTAGDAAYDFAFSYNYFPAVSDVCKELGIKYVSWVYDSPYLQVYSYTVLNSNNRIFLFDYAVYEELHAAGIPTVYYLPLGVNTKRMELMNLKKNPFGYREEVSFVGSLYSEKKHRLYDKFEGMAPYAKGYLDAIIESQKQLQGVYVLQKLLRDDIVEEMEKIYPTDPNSTSVLTPKALYADYVLARQVTAIERKELLEAAGRVSRVSLYTYEPVELTGVTNKGKIDYYDRMPYLFANSKVNLNITLRSIKTGIPLRALDIMGAGGFLLSNYQPELLEYFIPEEDFVYYEDEKDLREKVKYFMEHETKRAEIAANSFEKIKKEHDLRARIPAILGTL